MIEPLCNAESLAIHDAPISRRSKSRVKQNPKNERNLGLSGDCIDGSMRTPIPPADFLSYKENLLSKKTIITVFSGGELAGVGARDAGFEHIGGIEIEQDIANVAIENGFSITVGNVLDISPNKFDRPDVLHASPVCTRASLANNKRGEQPIDIAMGERTGEFIEALLPKVFTMENVPQYKDFKAFQAILNSLDKSGYFYVFETLNAADFGVPQTRKRLVLRAVRNGWVPHLPPPVEWVGWYKAIEDLIPALPKSQFAPWQLKRLPDDITTSLFAQQGYNNAIARAKKEEPAKTITSQHNQLTMRAFLMNVQGEGGDGLRVEDSPSQTIGATHSPNKYRAFIVNENRTSSKWIQESDIIDSEKPYATITANPHRPRAFLVSGGSAYKKSIDHVGGDDPSFTVKASIYKQPAKAWLDQGVVVQLTPRALARLQSIPDDYILPKNKTLAGKVIGNGFPCLMYQRILESFEGVI